MGQFVDLCCSSFAWNTSHTNFKVDHFIASTNQTNFSLTETKNGDFSIFVDGALKQDGFTVSSTEIIFDDPQLENTQITIIYTYLA